jgi:hypothetical protein
MKRRMLFGHAMGRLRIAKAAVLLGSLLMVQTGFAQQAPAVAPSQQAVAKPVAEEEGPAKPDKPGSEGIRIHGHWIIKVKNPDGTVVQHREFDNSLVGGPGLGMLSGDQLLAAMISGVGAAGGIGIALITGPVTTPGYDPSAYCATGYPSQVPVPAGIRCFGLVEANSLLAAAVETHVLKVAQTGLISQISFAPSVSIVLSGNFTVLGSYALPSIDAVQTYVGLCLELPTVFTPNAAARLTGTSQSFIRTSMSPSACAFSQNGPGGAKPPFVGAFTSTNLTTPVTNLLANQSVFISVTLSFS